MADIDWKAIFPNGMDAEFAHGYRDGRDAETPEPGSNHHPAYRHSWEVGRREITNHWPIPADFSRVRIAHIEAGGEFYPYTEASDNVQ